MRELTRADLADLPATPLATRAPYKAGLLVYDLGDEQVLLKDFSHKRGLLRAVLGPLLSGREAKALRALAGLPGVPQYRGRPDRYSVAMTYSPGARAARRVPEVRGDERFIAALERTVAAMHSRGVLHLDLKHRSNLLATPDGSPLVVDFESALVVRTGWPCGRLAVELLGRLDWLAVQNWKRRLCPRLLERSASARRGARLARRLQGWWLPRRVLDVLLDIYARRPGP